MYDLCVRVWIRHQTIAAFVIPKRKPSPFIRLSVSKRDYMLRLCYCLFPFLFNRMAGQNERRVRTYRAPIVCDDILYVIHLIQSACHSSLNISIMMVLFGRALSAHIFLVSFLHYQYVMSPFYTDCWSDRFFTKFYWNGGWCCRYIFGKHRLCASQKSCAHAHIRMQSVYNTRTTGPDESTHNLVLLFSF